MQQGGCYFLDFRRHGRREKNRLTIPRELLNNPLDIGHESHIEHAIGFVQNEETKLAQIAVVLMDQVQEASWGRDDDVDSFDQSSDLRPLPDAAEYRRMADLGESTDCADIFRDLNHEFASGGKNQA